MFLQMPPGRPSFRVMVSVVDLDPKPIHRLATWIRKKEDWLTIYKETTGDAAARPLASERDAREELVAV